MKKSIIILFIAVMYVSSFNSLKALTAFQQDCFGAFASCMNDAELEYTSTVGAIQGSEEKAQQIYVRAVRSCVSAYGDCPQQ